MDSEDELILKTIFKDSFPEQWKENPEFLAYLDELASCSVSKLSKEPDRLREERATILEQTQDLAFHNYKTFIQTAECSQEIFQDFNLVEHHLDSLLIKLPEFIESCGEFTKRSQEISASRRLNSLSLQKHPQLLEILELPQLMDTCVRNGYYEEALELTSYVRRLGKKHTNIPIIMTIVKEVQECNVLMLNQLLAQLRSNVQLPTCLKVIGFLRRMNVFSEAELRIKFLQSRDIWFQNILSTIPTDEVCHHISKTIEVSRVHLFDIITQYRAIFSDDDPLLSSGRDNPDINEAAIFHGWILRKITQFIGTLENDLEKGVSQGIMGRLDSILSQAMYFGLSFSRVGADFRGLIAPIFEKFAVRNFVKCAENAAKKFSENIESFTLSSLSFSSSYYPAADVDRLAPPNSLIEFHPLAIFCNKILSGFNELRLCCPLSTAQLVSEALQKSSLCVVNSIVNFHRAEETAWTDQELKSFIRMCHVICDDLVPFLDLCLQSMFPATQLSEVLGCSLSQVHAMKLVGTLDKTEITNVLKHFLPSEEDTGITLNLDQKLSLNDASSTIQEAPETVEPAPELEEPAPELEEPAPKLEEPAPKLEEPAPKLEEPAPKLEEPAPEVEEPVTAMEEPTIALEETETKISEEVTVPQVVNEDNEINESSPNELVHEPEIDKHNLSTTPDESENVGPAVAETLESN